jgi:hypothetical protein
MGFARFLRWVLVSVALCAAGGASAQAASASRIALVDLIPAFDEAWSRTAALPDAARVSAFKAAFDTALPGFYSHHRRKLPQARYDELLLRHLQRYPETRDGIASVSRRFSGLFQPALAGFEAAFGLMEGYPPLYLVHSLGEFDGGVRTLAGGTHLLFGADVIARIHGDNSIQAFFHHELFHLYHGRSFQECDRVWCGLWAEGLAVQVAAALNPRATDAELLLTIPEPIRPRVDAARREAVCAVLQRLDSEQEADYASLFLGSKRLSENLPPRFGYYVGYLAAADMARERTLKELARLPNAQVRPLLETALRRLAECP